MDKVYGLSIFEGLGIHIRKVINYLGWNFDTESLKRFAANISGCVFLAMSPKKDILSSEF